MVFCVKCGFEITDESSKFCPKCGANIIKNSESKESEINSVSTKPTSSISKRSNKKVIAISVILSLIAVFIIVPFIINGIGGFGDSYNLNQDMKKHASCNNQMYTDVNGRTCCFDEAEYRIWKSVNQKMCPYT
jgi:hypothetical protein